MREIKFRAWDGERMHYDALKATLQPEQKIEGLTLPPFYRASFSLVNMLDLMQFTGLKDKNGVEIYEGDVVKWHGDPQILHGYGVANGLGVVTWIHAEARFVFDFQGVAYPQGGGHTMAYHNRCAVIGNIYENPELLEAP